MIPLLLLQYSGGWTYREDDMSHQENTIILRHNPLNRYYWGLERSDDLPQGLLSQTQNTQYFFYNKQKLSWNIVVFSRRELTSFMNALDKLCCRFWQIMLPFLLSSLQNSFKFLSNWNQNWRSNLFRACFWCWSMSKYFFLFLGICWEHLKSRFSRICHIARLKQAEYIIESFLNITSTDSHVLKSINISLYH